MELDSGATFMSICDGMGSGPRAEGYSEVVIDLLEQLLESGFTEQTALKLINSVLLTGNQWREPAAVDMALFDRYSGTCQFLKMGAACTYIKRGGWVECIKSTSLPMGIFEQVDMETITKNFMPGILL
ncbi:MAG: SpoIIE family protein phosphatase [Eubacterium ventriosum]